MLDLIPDKHGLVPVLWSRDPRSLEKLDKNARVRTIDRQSTWLSISINFTVILSPQFKTSFLSTLTEPREPRKRWR